MELSMSHSSDVAIAAVMAKNNITIEGMLALPSKR
jgi:hypothetical protein